MTKIKIFSGKLFSLKEKKSFPKRKTFLHQNSIKFPGLHGLCPDLPHMRSYFVFLERRIR